MTDHIDNHNLFHYGKKLEVANAVAAIIKVDDGRYLMQLRDDKQGIFYPDHWGLFGGAVDPGEEPDAALRRELVEELTLVADNIRYFTRMDFDFGALGGPPCYRLFYEVLLPAAALETLHLGEGRKMEALTLPDLLLSRRVVPYDSFALWMYHTAHNAD